MGYLFCLSILAAGSFYGCCVVISKECPSDYHGEFGYLGQLFLLAKCQPWLAWVAVNAVFHFTWVTTLAICQSYQVRLI